jgi:hypothetical protein
MKRFASIKVGDQLELPVRKDYLGRRSNRDPDGVSRVKIVTHRWYDPVDQREYVGLAGLKIDGSYDEPNEKRTITGLARAGYRPASQDWIAYAKQLHQGEKVVSIFKPLRPSAESGKVL